MDLEDHARAGEPDNADNPPWRLEWSTTWSQDRISLRRRTAGSRNAQISTTLQHNQSHIASIIPTALFLSHFQLPVAHTSMERKLTMGIIAVLIQSSAAACRPCTQRAQAIKRCVCEGNEGGYSTVEGLGCGCARRNTPERACGPWGHGKSTQRSEPREIVAVGTAQLVDDARGIRHRGETIKARPPPPRQAGHTCQPRCGPDALEASRRRLSRREISSVHACEHKSMPDQQHRCQAGCLGARHESA
jgi:hypothetical protein